MSEEENAYVRNIVKEILRECFPKKIKVNKNFLIYLTKVLLINPNWGINDDFFNQRQNVQVFVKYVIDELLVNPYHPTMVTLKIQFYFSCNLEHMGYAIEMNHYDLRKKLSKLKEDIFIINTIQDKEEMDKLLKKIVYYITLISGLGDPTNNKVFEEVLFALKSILDDEELKEFATTSNSTKQASLEHFTRVVAGIRLFNKYCDKGGEGIANLPNLIRKAVNIIRQRAEMTLLLVMERVNLLTTIVDKCYTIKTTSKGLHVDIVLPKECLPNFSINYMTDLLIFFRQYELIMRKLIEEIEVISTRSEFVLKSIDKYLEKIHDTVFMRLAIPVGVVFPLFEELSDTWTHLQDQVILLTRFSQIISNLEMYARQVYNEEILGEQLSMDYYALTDAERLELTAHNTIESNNPNVSVYSIESFKSFDAVKLEYLGFCPWKLVETKGALIPGNPSMGVARYQEKNYVFSTVEASQEFCKNPELYVNYILDLAREKPQLIHFLQLKEELEKVYSIEKLVQSKSDLKMCEDKAVGTDDHVVEKHISPTYKWNIWDYKRHILNMTNIAGYVTVSVQSDKVFSKAALHTQTYCTKEVGTNTVRDNYTNVPKPSTFIYGLRGRKDDKQFLIDMTEPISK
ncbi:cilia- and flagella-associated protein 206-like [Rhynchophorus ferrugineus]|uniref:cilia- and flagella-associated protein 206-like n=1 Tax=Rhynchophorus ferrugineus TaxID=354439 RepID=UPI003FCC8901